MIDTKKSVLVTGGTGFVGRHVIARLVREGRRVTATTTQARQQGDEGVAWVQWDARAQRRPQVAWEDVDAIIHLAKPRDAVHGGDPQVANYTLSAAATFELLSAARQFNVRRFLFASTGYVLGRRYAPALETDNGFDAQDAYGQYKACGERITAAFAGELSTATLRFYWPYGPGGERYLVNRILHAVRTGRDIPVADGKGVWINPVWIDDLVDGIVCAIDLDAGGTFHLGGPETVSLGELARTAGRLVDRMPVLRSAAGEPDWHVGDMKLARSVLGYQPAVDVPTGLQRLIFGQSEVAA